MEQNSIETGRIKADNDKMACPNDLGLLYYIDTPACAVKIYQGGTIRSFIIALVSVFVSCLSLLLRYIYQTN